MIRSTVSCQPRTRNSLCSGGLVLMSCVCLCVCIYVFSMYICNIYILLPIDVLVGASLTDNRCEWNCEMKMQRRDGRDAMSNSITRVSRKWRRIYCCWFGTYIQAKTQRISGVQQERNDLCYVKVIRRNSIIIVVCGEGSPLCPPHKLNIHFSNFLYSSSSNISCVPDSGLDCFLNRYGFKCYLVVTLARMIIG